jgi:hypothetical protein
MEFGKTMNTKKLRNFRANPTVYYTHQSHKQFENHHENTVHTNMQFGYSVDIYIYIGLIRP